MNILVIKQTSLGDVLHATGHVRTIKENFPGSRLTLLTDITAADIFRHNPHVDRLLLIDRYRIKRDWYKEPVWALGHIREVMAEVRRERYDLAFDLQGLLKSVIFLYGAEAGRKYVKGHWRGLQGFRRPELHAIRELDGVLEAAGLTVRDSSMEFFTSQAECETVDGLLARLNPLRKPLVVISPFTRWPSKNWPLERFMEAAHSFAGPLLVAMTGAKSDRKRIQNHLVGEIYPDIANLAGRLTLPEFAELTRRAALTISGDSFPMHVAGAVRTPVLALFGPTDETKTGPLGDRDAILRAPDCDRCDRPRCEKACLGRIEVETVLEKAHRMLDRR